MIFLFLTSSILSIIFIVFSKFVSKLLWGQESYYFLIIFFAISFPFYILTIVIDAYIRGIKKHNIFTSITIINSILSTTIFVLLAYHFKEYGVAIAFTISSFISLIVTLTITKFSNIIDFRLLIRKITLDFKPLNNVIKLGVASLIIGASNQFVLLFIRSEIIKMYGIEYNGYYQSIISISSSYFAIFGMLFGVYFLPILSERKKVTEIQKDYNFSIFISLLLIVPIILFLYQFNEIIIPLLFSKDFITSSNYLLFYLYADFFRIFSQVMELRLISQNKIKVWIFIEIITYLSMLLIFLFLKNFTQIGPVSFSYSFLGAYVISTVINVVYVLYNKELSIDRGNFKLFVSSVIILSFLYFHKYMSFYISLGITIILFIIWIFINIKIKLVKEAIFLISNKIQKQ